MGAGRVTVRESAAILGTSETLIWNAVAAGYLPTSKVGARVSIDRSDLVAWSESRDPHQVRSRNFWAKVAGDDPLGCWLWGGGKTAGGYGVFGSHGTQTTAHRWAYEALIAPIPEGLHIDHLCRVRACVNPWHMEPVPPSVNTARRPMPPLKTHCVHGHPFNEQNTYYQGTKRTCRECNRIASLRKRTPGVPLSEINTERRWYRSETRTAA